MDERQFAEMKGVVVDGLKAICEGMKARDGDHDTMIQIRTLIQQQDETLDRDRRALAETLGVMRSTADKAHQRIDALIATHDIRREADKKDQDRKFEKINHLIWGTVIIGGLMFIGMCATLITTNNDQLNRRVNALIQEQKGSQQ